MNDFVISCVFSYLNLFLLDLYYFIIVLYLNDSTLMRNTVKKWDVEAEQTGWLADLDQIVYAKKLRKRLTFWEICLLVFFVRVRWSISLLHLYVKKQSGTASLALSKVNKIHKPAPRKLTFASCLFNLCKNWSVIGGLDLATTPTLDVLVGRLFYVWTEPGWRLPRFQS